jgi:hypothetical protein
VYFENLKAEMKISDSPSKSTVRLHHNKCNVPAVTRKIYGRRQKLPESSVVKDRKVWNYLEEGYSLIIVTTTSGGVIL